MTKKIFEELPARKTPPAAAPMAHGSDKKGGGDSEKRIKQAVYDIRYRAKQSGMDLRAAYAQYMSGSKLSAQEQAVVKAKLFGKGKAVKEDYNSLMSKGVTSGVANALFKVFVEGQEPEIVYEEEGGEIRKYKIRVTDEKTGRSYVRYADRSKITALREKGLKVEMTEHGEPKGEKKKGGLDPVAKNPAQRDGDVNNDGKKDKTDSYIYNRRDAINAAIARKKGMKEEFLVDGTTSTEGQNKGKITGAGVDNYATGVVKVMPENGADASPKARKGIFAHTETKLTPSQLRLMEMITEKKKVAESKIGKECSCCGNKITESGCGCGPDCGHCGGKGKVEESVKEEKKSEKKECTPGESSTYREVLKNKLRSAGKRVIAATGDDAEGGYEKMATASFIKVDKETGNMKPVSLYGEALVMVADSLIEEGYSENHIFDAIDNLNEEQMQELEEGLGALLKLGTKALKSGAGKKILSKAANLIKGGKKGKSAISKRATKVVKDQRAGVAGTDDALNKGQQALDKSMSRLRRQERRGGQAAASLNAKAVERDVRRAAAYGPQTSSSKPFGQRIDPPKSTGGKVKVEIPKQSSIGRPLSYKEMMAQRRKEWAGKSEAEKQEIFNQYLKRWKQNNK